MADEIQTLPSPIRCGDENYELDAYIWRRRDEWVLEISGSINDTSFIIRHTEPGAIAPEEVAGLPTLYALAEDRIKNPSPVGYLIEHTNYPPDFQPYQLTEADKRAGFSEAPLYLHPPSNAIEELTNALNEALEREMRLIAEKVALEERAEKAEAILAAHGQNILELPVDAGQLAEAISKATSFRFSDEITVESRGHNSWVVTSGGRTVLNDLGEFEFEPMPSSRSEEFIAKTRMPFSEAWSAARKIIEAKGSDRD